MNSDCGFTRDIADMNWRSALFTHLYLHIFNQPIIIQGVIMEQGDTVFTNQTDAVQLKCPVCQYEHIETRNIGKKAGGTIGTAAGAVAGASGAMSGAEVGATVGLVGGPVGVAVGGFFGAIIGGLIGAAAGHTVGTNIGKVVDDTMLENYYCPACDHTFGKNDI
jgi:hypothetical protein